MIDQLALALGHGLLAVALLRLALRADVDADPLMAELNDEAAEKRRAVSTAGRKAARRAAGKETGSALKQRSGSADNPALKQRKR